MVLGGNCYPVADNSLVKIPLGIHYYYVYYTYGPTVSPHWKVFFVSGVFSQQYVRVGSYSYHFRPLGYPARVDAGLVYSYSSILVLALLKPVASRMIFLPVPGIRRSVWRAASRLQAWAAVLMPTRGTREPPDSLLTGSEMRATTTIVMSACTIIGELLCGLSTQPHQSAISTLSVRPDYSSYRRCWYKFFCGHRLEPKASQLMLDPHVRAQRKQTWSTPNVPDTKGHSENKPEAHTFNPKARRN